MSNRTIIIAEAGVNHNGDPEIAKRLIQVAKDAGADYVKFQTFKADLLVSSTAKKADYQVENTGNAEESQLDMLKKLELKEDAHHMLKHHCEELGIGFLSSPFDVDSAKFLAELGIDLFKVPSGELTNLPLLEYLAQRDEPVVLSTGMAAMEEIGEALKVLEKGKGDLSSVTVLHCNTEYPTPWEDVNLNAMKTIRQAFSVDVGYSDHTTGIEVPIAATALDAKIIEKHFTLDKNMEGPDHKASLDPDELKSMVDGIRHIETALGSNEKTPTTSESKNRPIARKSIHLSVDVHAGQTIEASHLAMKRPGDGISPMEMNDLIGKRYTKDLSGDHKLDRSDIE